MTGGAKRIGKAIALELARLGYSIAVHYHQSREAACEIASVIKKTGRPCEIFSCDLSVQEQTSSLIETVRKQFPNLKLLVNSASLFEKADLRQTTLESLRGHFAINFNAAYILSCGFARLCRIGQIINILDTNIVKNTTSYPTYLLSKKSLAEFTKLAAVAFAPSIRVNAVAPGLILAPAKRGNTSLDRLAKNIPLRRRGDVSHVTHAIRFFIENDYVTGQTIFVDGGEHLL